ncbi:MAG TPA: SPOR domain-containing protein [Blastocatellia bacterium]|nr:SPOR domain-containing protein [Blastocatellia bacterium]
MRFKARNTTFPAIQNSLAAFYVAAICITSPAVALSATVSNSWVRNWESATVVFAAAFDSGVQETRPRKVHPNDDGASAKAAPSPAQSNSTQATSKADKGITKRNAPGASESARRGPKAEPKSSNRAGPFTVQLGAFVDRENAERLSRQLKEGRYNPVIVTMTGRRQRVWYLVRLGSYLDAGAARGSAREIEKALKIKAVVRPADTM